VRFTPSGTEANLQAVRLARAYTGKEKIAKFEGCYHGSWDAVDVSVSPSLEKAGPAGSPLSVRQNEGLPDGVLQNTVVLPYNDAAAVEKILRMNKDDLAAVIIDPCWRDEETDHEFVRALRDVTQSLGILLIFDEVIAFRVGHLGAQGLYGVKPDITTMGKIIGGGFPVGAYASTSEIMKPQTWPEAKFPDLRGARLAFSGTFNAHPVTMAAGLAVLEQMQPSEFDALNRTGQAMRENLKKILNEEGVSARVGGVGSLFNIAWTAGNISNYRDSANENRALGRYLSLALMNRGVFMLGHANVSAAVTSKDLTTVAEAVRQSVEELKPIIKERTPGLLKG
jgi:glutamate-1-semialdehyde 2,1-aminomutase